jgi:hypothetical protein
VQSRAPHLSECLGKELRIPSCGLSGTTGEDEKRVRLAFRFRGEKNDL